MYTPNETICNILGLRNIFYTLTESIGTEGRGLIGDVTKMLLDITKARASGWDPKHTSSDEVQLAFNEILNDKANQGL